MHGCSFSHSQLQTLNCPCEAVSLSNVSDYLKLKISRDLLYLDPHRQWEPAPRRQPPRSRPDPHEFGSGQSSAGRRARPTGAPHSAAPLRTLRMWKPAGRRQLGRATETKSFRAHPEARLERVRQFLGVASGKCVPRPAHGHLHVRACRARLGASAGQQRLPRRGAAIGRSSAPPAAATEARLTPPRLREECSPSSCGVPRHAEALGSANALLTVL